MLLKKEFDDINDLSIDKKVIKNKVNRGIKIVSSNVLLKK